MKKLFIGIVFVLMFLGCANKRLAKEYYYYHNYEKSYEIYIKYAKRGFPEYADKVAKLIYSDKVNRPPFIERKYAMIAYKNGYKKDSLFIADSYFREKKYKNALDWYIKTDFNFFSIRDYKNYLDSVLNLDKFSLQIKYLNKLENYAKKSNNPKLLTMLGKFYITDSPFFNKNKGIDFLKKAYYKYKFYKAGAILGIYYVKNNKEDDGFKILKNVMNYDANAAYYVGNYLYNKMISQEKLMNYKCVSVNSSTPIDFFEKKLSIYKYNNLFTITNIVKAYKKSYELGNKKALYKLIRLDIEDNTFELEKNTYSGFNLNEAVNFLKSQNDVESKLILAKIYEKYLYLKSYKEAKNIYLWYENINEVQALWHLYQYEKRFENKINFDYLNYLVKNDFVPAIIEKAYQESIKNIDIENNKKTLFYYANQGNLLALNYIGSLYSREIYLPKSQAIYYYKIACELENKPFYIPSEDLKIANYFDDYLKNKEKYLTINYYYAQMNNRLAELNIAKYYKDNCEYNKTKKWLNILKKQNDLKFKNYYYQLVLQRYIDGNITKALSYIKSEKSIISFMLLGDYYSNGYWIDINPTLAKKYYLKAYNNGYYLAIYKIINMYTNLNINHVFDSKIEKYLKIAVKDNVKNSKYYLAKYYYDKGYKQKAYKILMSIKNINSNPKAKYLLYLITGRLTYVNNGDSNYGYILLAKARNYSKSNLKQALYYTFRAMLCNTPEADKLSYELMKQINNANIIKSIYIRAKKAPKCYIK